MTQTFHIPAQFILGHITLSWRDVQYGYDAGWLGPYDVVDFAVARLVAQNSDDEIEIELAGITKSEYHDVGRLLSLLAERQPSGDDVSIRDKWCFLLNLFLYFSREQRVDALADAEQLYTEFGYPEDMSSFIGYMPATGGYRPQDHTPEENRQHLYKNWFEYLAAKSARYGVDLSES